jgi:uncharacterized protein (UPF0276 family)
VVAAAVVVVAEDVEGKMMRDRIGIGWRPELAAGILLNLDRIDVVEVLADDFFDAPRRAIRALRTLAAQVPVVLHGVTMGLASSVPVEVRRLEQMARLVDQMAPDFWSEHLAFVRAGGFEIGHLAAPPRTGPGVEAVVRNLASAQAVVGARPLVENVATLIDPPGSDYDEPTWIAEILAGSDCDLLLDLHNLYANAVNFGFDAKAFLARIPPHRIAAVHLAGGKWIAATDAPDLPSDRRWLDDHLHDVPDVVYDLLTEVGRRTSRGLTVILERDGQYPAMAHLLAELDRARRALALGRACRAQPIGVEVV